MTPDQRDRFTRREAHAVLTGTPGRIVVARLMSFLLPFCVVGARALGVALVFAATWVAFTVVLLRVNRDTPDTFRRIVLAADTVAVAVVLLALGASNVEANLGGITVSGRVAGFGTRRLDTRDLQAVEVADAWGSWSTPYYNIRAVTVGGSPVTLGRSIRDKREAEWNAREIWAAVRGER